MPLADNAGLSDHEGLFKNVEESISAKLIGSLVASLCLTCCFVSVCCYRRRTLGMAGGEHRFIVGDVVEVVNLSGITEVGSEDFLGIVGQIIGVTEGKHLYQIESFRNRTGRLVCFQYRNLRHAAVQVNDLPFRICKSICGIWQDEYGEFEICETDSDYAFRIHDIYGKIRPQSDYFVVHLHRDGMPSGVVRLRVVSSGIETIFGDLSGSPCRVYLSGRPYGVGVIARKINIVQQVQMTISAKSAAIQSGPIDATPCERISRRSVQL